MTETLHSEVNGRVREAIQQSIARILEDADGSVTIGTKSGGILGLEGWGETLLNWTTGRYNPYLN